MDSANNLDSRVNYQSMMLDATTSAQKKQRQKAFADYLQGFMMWRTWMLLAWQDINIRYRRSVIGPLWITLSMAITVYSMGFLYARLFHIELEKYFPYLVSGMLGWGLIQSLINEGVDAYLLGVSLIRQVKLPYSFHIHRMCMRNFIIAGHNVLVMIPIYLFFNVHMHWWSLVLFFANIVIFYFFAFLVSNVLALVCARFRDMGQIVKSIVQVFFFLTPVMWDPSILGIKYQRLMLLNPMFDLIQLLRQPLIGLTPTFEQYAMVGLYMLLGVVVNYVMFVRYRARIVYWL
jgi:ABC-type polysaccharide/polyol phosphate export permease